jgi:hypothetical protein
MTSFHGNKASQEGEAKAATASNSSIPSQLDIHFITSNLLVGSSPRKVTESTCNDTGQDHETGTIYDTHPPSAKNNSTLQQQHNSIDNLSAFINQQHNQNYLFFNLDNASWDDSILLALHHQLVHIPTVPSSLAALLNACYALDAWLSSSQEQNVGVVCCANGKSRSALVVACFLKFTGRVACAHHGFLHVLASCQMDDGERIYHTLPASVPALMRNFDACISLGRFVQTKPLLLRAVAVQGLPLETAPTIHIVTANNESTLAVVAAAWADEDGFYRVNRIVRGEFKVECRFEGSNVTLFQYSNTTGFVAAGVREFAAHQVDWLRQYKQVMLDNQDFLLTLVFESHWNCPNEAEAELLRHDCSEEELPTILDGAQAREEGWKLIAKRHAAQPTAVDVDRFVKEGPAANQLKDCPRHLLFLALQVTDLNWKRANELLTTGPFSWWQAPQDESQPDPEIVNEYAELSGTKELEARRLQAIFDILDDDKEGSESCYGLRSTNPESSTDSFWSSSGRQNSESREDGFPASATVGQDQRLNTDSGLIYNSPVLKPRAGDVLNAYGAKPLVEVLKSTQRPLKNSKSDTGPVFPLLPKDGNLLSSPFRLEDPKN